MERILNWKKNGVFLRVPELSNHNVFYRLSGKSGAKVMVLLHGFPSSSYDFHKIIGRLEEQYHVLCIDLLGFGFSDKPSGFPYSIFSQADLVEQVLTKLKIESIHLMIAHDYSVSIAQELMARHRKIQGIVLLNGAIYPHLHRPVFFQKLLKNKFIGPLVSRLVSRRLFGRSMRKLFSSSHQPDDLELDDFWAMIRVNSGNWITHRLVHFIQDRQQNADRWVDAIENSTTPLALVWGMKDPVSGPPVFEFAKRHIKRASFFAFDELGHYPHFEDPEIVLECILKFAKGIQT